MYLSHQMVNCCRCFFGGDQLTRERAYHAQDTKLQSKDPKSRLVGLVPKVEDWHTRVTFYQVCTHALTPENCHYHH